MKQPIRLAIFFAVVLVANIAVSGQPPATAEDWSKMGSAQLSAKQYEAAAKSASECIRLNSRLSHCYEVRSLSNYFLAKYTEAAQDAAKMIEINPGNSNAYGFRADALVRLGKYEEGLADYAKAISMSKTSLLYYSRGVAYYEMDQYTQAIDDFTRAIGIDQKFSRAYYGRGTTYFDLKKYELSIADLTKYIELEPRSYLGFFERGRNFEMTGKHQEALNDYTKAIELNPKSASAYNNRGYNYFRQDKKGLAIADYTKAIELFPRFAGAYKNRGYVYFLQLEFDRAISDLDKAIEIEPKFEVAYNDRGSTYFAQKKYTDALRDYSKAIEISPKWADPVYNTGIVYRDLKNNEKAIEFFTKAIEIDGKYSLAYEQRGYVYSNQRNFENAIKDFDELIKLKPEVSNHFVDRGYWYFQLKDYAKGHADLNKALQLNPKNKFAHNNRGYGYYLEGKNKEALDAYSKAIELDAKFQYSYFGRSQAYCKLGMTDKANADERMASELGRLIVSPCRANPDIVPVKESVDTSKYTSFDDAIKSAEALVEKADHESATDVFEIAFALAKDNKERSRALIGFGDAGRQVKLDSASSKRANTERRAEFAELQKKIKSNYIRVTTYADAPSDLRMNAHRALISIYNSENRFAEALTEQKKLLEFAELPAAEKLLLIERIANSSGNPAERIEFYERLIADKSVSDGKRGELYLKMAPLYETLKREDKLVALYNSILKLKGASDLVVGSAYGHLARRDIDAKKYPDAIRKLNTLLELKTYPVADKIWYVKRIVEQLLKDKQNANAKLILEKSIAITDIPENEKVLMILWLGNIYFDEKNYPVAHKYYDQIPDTYDARLNKIRAYYQQKDTKNAAIMAVSTLEIVSRNYYSATTQDQKQQWFDVTNQLLKDLFGLAGDFEKNPESKSDALLIYKAMIKVIPAGTADGKIVAQKIAALETK